MDADRVYVETSKSASKNNERVVGWWMVDHSCLSADDSADLERIKPINCYQLTKAGVKLLCV